MDFNLPSLSQRSQLAVGETAWFTTAISRNRVKFIKGRHDEKVAQIVL
jgi:hypothetical protein